MTDQQHHSGEHESLDPNRPFIQPPPNYKVGYGKPPVQTRFQPGQSGNPKGRPKGSKNGLSQKATDKIFDLVGIENEREITLKEDGQPVKVSTLEGVLRAISVNSLKGKVGSQKLFWQIQMEYAEHNRQRDEALFEAMKNYKRARQAEIDAAERDGIELKPSFPHPSHIHLNHLTRTVDIDGPMNHVEQEKMEQQIEHRDIEVWRYLHLIDLLNDGEHEDQFEAIQAKIDQASSLIMLLELGLPRVERLDPNELGFGNIPLETLEANAQPPHEIRKIELGENGLYYPKSPDGKYLSYNIPDGEPADETEIEDVEEDNDYEVTDDLDEDEPDDEEFVDESDDPDFDDEDPEWEDHEDWDDEEEGDADECEEDWEGD